VAQLIKTFDKSHLLEEAEQQITAFKEKVEKIKQFKKRVKGQVVQALSEKGEVETLISETEAERQRIEVTAENLERLLSQDLSVSFEAD